MNRVEKHIARALDFGMCAMMNAVQFRHRLHASSRAELEHYIARCEPMTREEYFHAAIIRCHPERSPAPATQVPGAVEAPVILNEVEGSLISSGHISTASTEEIRGPLTSPRSAQDDADEEGAAAPLRWQSPVRTAFAENNRVHVNLFPCTHGWSAPTVLMLH